MLKIENIHFSYGEKKILQGVTLSAAKGEIIALIGVSGSGKTTLFRLITGLITPLQGEIAINGQSLPEGALLTTYMRQDDLLLPWRTVMGNLLLFSELGKKRSKNEALLQEATSLLKKVGLENSEGLYPRELSGGMRQRVALARTLLQNRPLMLLDEPFASLDVIMREQLYSLLREIRDHYQKTLLMVTHDFRDALALADRILVLANGKISGTYLLNPQNKLHSETLIQKIRYDLSTISG
jgi:ABC-type nitrate/sulfonate/bicarbonate transport system ATPase subunit